MCQGYEGERAYIEEGERLYRQRGREAFLAGVPRDQNPHKIGLITYSRDAWYLGWDIEAAKADKLDADAKAGVLVRMIVASGM